MAMRVLQTIALMLVLVQAIAQGRAKTLTTDTGMVRLHYFTTGELSTKEWRDQDDRWGRTWAYGRDGRVLIDHQTRKIAGHSSVHFEYHKNGGVSKAEISDAPDAGIQWYRSTTTFDAEGNKTGFTEQGHDDDGIIPSLHPSLEQPQPPIVVPTPKPVEFTSEVYVANGSSWPVLISVEAKDASLALHGSQFMLPPGESVLVATYSDQNDFISPVQKMTVTGTVTNRRGKKKTAGVLMMEKRQVDKQRRAWFYHVMPNGGRVGFGF